MKVSESWLREWVNPPLNGQQLAEQLTMAGLEVDAYNSVAGEFDKVIVALVVKTQPHPQADKLTLCQVEIGQDHLIQVVCGAVNVRTGLRVALAMPGAHLPGGIHIKESMLRGQLSQGMLCSTTELGMEERADGIYELAEDAPIGVDLRDYLELNDHVFDIDLTPNRADCFSVLGIARDVAAINQLPYKILPEDVVPPTLDETKNIHLVADKACPQYCGRIIRGINTQGKTPLWMQERLRRAGVRTLHPVVDVTNYVMLELGAPMHAFDLQGIDGDIQVRYATDNECLVLLDGQEATLNKQILVIADQCKPLAIAGVMGGSFSAVQEQTTDIFLESAFFNPVSLAGVARHFGLSSESSQRFERGVDPSLQVVALERATCLLHEIVGGEVAPITFVSKAEHLPSRASVFFRPAQVKQLSGIDIAENDMLHMLMRLGMSVDSTQAIWRVEIPSYRFDIALEADLVEEVIRLYGYDKIPAMPMVAVMQAGKINPSTDLLTRCSAFLCSRGYHETISYSFVDPQLQSALYPNIETMQLLNPISSELSQMRVGMWPGLLASMVYNMHRQQTALKLFEAGVVFDVHEGKLEERACLAGLITGENGSLNWSEHNHKFDFYDLKGDLQALLSTLNLSKVRFVAAEHGALHPGQTAQILVGNKAVGWIGALHPRLLDALDLTSEVLLFELSLASLLDSSPVIYQKISKYPQTRRDLSLLVNIDVSAEQIEDIVREVVAKDCLKSVAIFDVYMGEGVPDGKKSLAIALIFQNDSRTLIDIEINTIINNILIKLETEFSITLRTEI